VAKKERLSGSPRSGQDDGREMVGGLGNLRLELAVDVPHVEIFNMKY
jgi:hypothetical protein